MFTFKKKYFLIIESIKDINLSNIKKQDKFCIIYRPGKLVENLADLKKFKKNCFVKKIKFFITNDTRLCISTKADGVYLSAYNKTFKSLNLKKLNLKIIGSAHNYKEINLKIKQGCDFILLSKLFFVNYKKNSPLIGVVKFNKFLTQYNKNLIPLGGINFTNLNKLNVLKSIGFAIMSEVKKKPAITDRLF